MKPESGLGIAGLIPLFKECTQLFDLIDPRPPDQADFELLSTILEIEQARLWCVRHNLHSEVDDRLKDRRIAGAVSDVLKCIKSAIEDSRSLKWRYRLQTTDTVDSPESREIAPRTTFKRTLERFNSASRSPLNASIKLVIVDEKLFPTLVEDLCGFNDNLACLLPDIDSFQKFCPVTNSSTISWAPSSIPSFRSLGAAKYHASSLIIDGKSYWRAKSAVGRVFGGMEGIKAVCGWVGPCPASIEDSITGWVRTSGAAVGFSIPGKPIVGGFDHGDDGELGKKSTSSWAMPTEATLTPQWLANMSDKTKWNVPEVPKPPSERCEFLGLHLKPMHPVAPPAVPQDKASAIIDFNVDGKPSFVASHPCVNRTHLQHSNDMKRFQNVCTIRDLKNLRRIPVEVLIIDATCDGGELVRERGARKMLSMRL
ncbi:hypothetical protein V500_08293 [Pseudogymnoascus sp. VKM F-4518 (FW-2643)]|nr:hypothetical protein V500_08293 [Pseudogymnoascus sp. VKM F-4518 (FW-2643)]